MSTMPNHCGTSTGRQVWGYYPVRVQLCTRSALAYSSKRKTPDSGELEYYIYIMYVIYAKCMHTRCYYGQIHEPHI